MGLRQHALTAAVLLAASATAGAANWLQPSRDDGLLSAEEAIEVSPALWENGHLRLELQAAPGVYVYRDRIVLEALPPARGALGPLTLPAGSAHRDEHFGEVRVLRGRFSLGARAAAAPQEIRIRYQGCAEDRVCYPPQTRVLKVENVQARTP